MRIEDLYPGLNLENKQVEFKKFLSFGKDETTKTYKQIKWLKTIAAFYNSEGGKIYVGVDDKTRTIVPIDAKTADEQILLVRQECQEKLNPPLCPKIDTVPIVINNETRYLITLEVIHSNRLPVMLKEGHGYSIYVRKYGYTELATPEEIRSLVLKDEKTSFDYLLTDEKYNPNDFSLLKEEYSHNHEGKILQDKTLGLKNFFDQNEYLRNGAVLFKDDYDGDKTNISIVKWPSLDRGSSKILAIYKLKGPITKLISEANEKVSMLTTNGLIKTNDGEKPLIAYPQRSVLEGIANAFAHKNYWMEGVQIQVDIFLDRMEITSPGSLLSGKALKNEKNIGSIIPQHRNKLIASILNLVGMIQGLGTGFDKIENDYSLADANHKPYINSDDESFTLVLPDLTYGNGVINESNNKVEIYVPGMVISQGEKELLSYCYLSSKSVSEIASKLGVKVSTYLKEKIIGELVANGLLVKVNQRPAKYIASHSLVKIMSASN